MNKMDYDKFSASVDLILTPAQREIGLTDKVLNLLKTTTLSNLPDEVKDHPSVSELSKLIDLLNISKIDNVEFDLSLMRGFDYYTDIVFEVFDTHPDNNRSMFGGGRYDGLVALFNVDPIPTVGFGMGDVTLENFLEIHELLPELNTKTDVGVVLVGDVYDQAIGIINQLRDMNVNVSVDSSGNKVEKQIKSAIKNNLRYVLFIGEEELKNKQYKLKNLKTEEEELHSIERIVTIVKDYRQN